MIWIIFIAYLAGALSAGLLILLALCLMVAAARADAREEEIRADYGP